MLNIPGTYLKITLLYLNITLLIQNFYYTYKFGMHLKNTSAHKIPL